MPAFAADALPRAVGEGESTLRPQLEFIFRTLVEMRMDMDELRREFERYREAGGGRSMATSPGVEIHIPERIGEPEIRPLNGQPATAPAEEHGVVVYRSGMKMDDLERAAILAALADELVKPGQNDLLMFT